MPSDTIEEEHSLTEACFEIDICERTRHTQMSAPIPIPQTSLRRTRAVYEEESTRTIAPALLLLNPKAEREANTTEHFTFQTSGPRSYEWTSLREHDAERYEEIMDKISSSPLTDVDFYFENHAADSKRKKKKTKSTPVEANANSLETNAPVRLPSRESINWKGLLVFKDNIAHYDSSDEEKTFLPAKSVKHPLFDFFYAPADPLDEGDVPIEYDPTVPEKFKAMYEREKKAKEQKHLVHEHLRRSGQSHKISLDSELESEDDGEHDWNIKPLYGKSNLLKLLERASYNFYISPEQREQIEILGEIAGAVVMKALDRFYRKNGEVCTYHVESAIMHAYNRFIMLRYLLPEMKTCDKVTPEEIEETSRARVKRFYEALHRSEERHRLGVSPPAATLSAPVLERGVAAPSVNGDTNHEGVEDSGSRRKGGRTTDIPPPPQMTLTSLNTVPQSSKMAKQLASKLNAENAQKFRDDVKYNSTLLETWQKYHPGWDRIKAKMVEERFAEKHGLLPLWKMADDMLFPHLFKRSGVTADK